MDKLLDKKRTYTTTDGNEYLNLILPTVDIDKITINGYIKVNQDCKGRLDKFVYDNMSKDYNAIDIIMYANHIFNPFAIDEGEMLYTAVYKDNLFYKPEEPVLPDNTTLSSKNRPSLTYAQQIELLVKQGKGWG
jgi:hypothetical protein